MKVIFISPAQAAAIDAINAANPKPNMRIQPMPLADGRLFLNADILTEIGDNDAFSHFQQAILGRKITDAPTKAADEAIDKALDKVTSESGELEVTAEADLNKAKADSETKTQAAEDTAVTATAALLAVAVADVLDSELKVTITQ